jgi:acyl carrier protein
MKPMPDQDQVFSSLRAIFVQALRVRPDEVIPNARIFSDLGAESIDILDIQFQIEHAFGFSLDQNELIERLGSRLSPSEIDERLTVRWCVDYVSGRLSDAGDAEA